MKFGQILRAIFTSYQETNRANEEERPPRWRATKKAKGVRGTVGEGRGGMAGKKGKNEEWRVEKVKTSKAATRAVRVWKGRENRRGKAESLGQNEK